METESIDESQEDSNLAESFEIDFLNGKSTEVQNAMAEMGGFVFRSSRPESSGRVVFEGERQDGTSVKIEITKGSNYKAPAELAESK